MIEFINNNSAKPFLIFKNKYNLAIEAGQKNIEAISISSYNNSSSEVNSRYVNLKIINDNEFIFFTGTFNS